MNNVLEAVVVLGGIAATLAAAGWYTGQQMSPRQRYVTYAIAAIGTLVFALAVNAMLGRLV